jgi:outer membrane protein insertion porin family
MKINKPKLPYLLLFTTFLLASACNNTRYIPDGDALYTGASVKLKNSTATAKENKAMLSSLQGLTRPKPNSKILGVRLKLSIYNMAGRQDTGKTNFIKRLFRKYGEPPVLLSSVNLQKNEKVLTNNLENRGFFKARTFGDTTIKDKKASATYTVETGPQYKITEVTFPADSSQLTREIRSIIPASILVKGEPFNLDVIRGERTRIDAHLKEHGFYYFNPEQLLVLVDSTIGNDLVNLMVQVKPETPEESRMQYAINDVFIYSNYNINTARRDTGALDSAQITRRNRRARPIDTISINGYHVIDRRNTFKPAMFDRMMTFNPGELYNRTDHNLTLSRLINLGTFKFVKNRFEPLLDTFKLNSYYYLTPLPRKALSAELGALTKSNNSSGTEFSLRWRNRNAFKGAELLTITAYGGTDVQYSAQFSGIQTFRTGAEANLSFPRFVLPIFNFNTDGAFVPRTNMQLGYDIMNRRKLYTLNQFRAQFGYIWKKNISIEHTLNPIAFNYVQPLNVTKLYIDSISSHPEFGKIIDTQFIIGSNYNVNYNQLAGKEKNASGLYFNGLLDLSGNLIGALTGASMSNPKEILGAKFSQYIKTEADTRYYFKVAQKHQWANRLILGFGIPRGQSKQLPFIKQFFVGGNNSIRAFRSRSVGPGRYYLGQQNVGKDVGFFPEQTGDIKIEFNTEYRHNLSGIFNAAVFLDAGNIWLFNENPDQPGGKFTKDWLKELAVGAGIGLRIDLTILLLRIDLATPIRKPWLADGQRMVINQINLRERDWRRENLVLNLAIGLPF